MSRRSSHCRPVFESLREYGRGVAGGLMFSLPLLYTLEVWWAGFMLHPGRIIAYVLVTFLLLIAYNRFAGLRCDANWRDVVIDSMEEMGIGLILATVVLWLTGRLTGEMDVAETAGRIVLEGMTVAIGVSVGTAQLGVENHGDGGVAGDDEEEHPVFAHQVAIALCGSVLFAASVAPTEEVGLIAMESSPLQLIGLMAVSMTLGGLILYFTGFRGSDRLVAAGSWKLITRGILTTCAVALVAAAGSLFFFGQLDGDPLPLVAAKTVVAGLPAVLGGSAGRLLLQTRR